MEKLNASGRAQIILAGMETHVCILQTALELAGTSKEVFVVEDAVCAPGGWADRGRIPNQGYPEGREPEEPDSYARCNLQSQVPRHSPFA